MPVSEADLEKMLSGDLGVVCLDAGREIMELRGACQQLAENCQVANERALRCEERMEQCFNEVSESNARFNSLLEALANMVASARG